jgi:hypothetical protein
MARVRRRGGPTPRPIEQLIDRGLTHAPPPSTSVREQIGELGGTRAVAALTGRSERTIRRWAQNDHVPARGDAAQAFATAVNQHRDSPDYRRGRVNHRRETRMRNNGAIVRFQGVAGPVIDSQPGAVKRRNIEWHLSGDAMGDILDAYYAGGEAAAIAALGQAMAAEYMGSTQYGWTFENIISKLDFLRHRY